MTTSNAVTVLTEYLKYRQGRGKKYAEPDTPFDYDTVTESVREAIRMLKRTNKYIESITGVHA